MSQCSVFVGIGIITNINIFIIVNYNYMLFFFQGLNNFKLFINILVARGGALVSLVIKM